ncbi:MAG: hypothetical protein A4E42_01011 [Methanoregulaceae archaeon PtaU1.Bin222]|nr:MAG: hypothetical protein A4E42_01011 [Methanoregulaceae archaeon PtaU1.Bin222]
MCSNHIGPTYTLLIIDPCVYLFMERNHVIVVVLGLIVCVALFFIVDIYASLIALILVIALAMSFFIMEDSVMTPDLVVTLKEDARGIVVRNRGNAKALSIRLTLIPHDLTYSIPVLEEDDHTGFATDSMIERVKVMAEYKNEKGNSYEKTFTLSPLDRPEEDILKPAFPMFKWK